MQKDYSKDEERVETECGWFSLRPKFLQKFRTPGWALFWLCWAGGMQGLIVNGFINVVITTIERRFGLRSTQTGLIAGGYDMASFLFLIPVSYFGGRSGSSKPRYIGIGVLVLGLGSLVFATPHYLSGTYLLTGGQDENICDTTRNSTECVSESIRDRKLEPRSGFYLSIFVISQLLHGAGATPFYTLGVTYIDENVSKQMSSVYLGIFYTMAVIGPAIGYVIGGELLKIYVDFSTVNAESIGLTRDSNLWIGAWWIGFTIAFVVCIIIAIPVLAFPPSLPGAESLAKDKVSEAHVSRKTSSKPSTRSDQQDSESFTKVQEIPKALRELLSNPAFFMLNLAGASEGLLISGFAAFLPKLIENQYNITASSAAMLMGLATVPAGGGGTFLGGYVIKHWNMSCAAIIKLCCMLCSVCIIFTWGFLLNCPNLEFAGVTNLEHTRFTSKVSLRNLCNLNCGCSFSRYDPICGIDNITYYSPCYAGCSNSYFNEGVKTYSNCSCIDYNSENLNSLPRGASNFEAVNTACSSECNHLGPFLAMMFMMMLVSFCCSMPALAATLRVVRDDQRSFALGIQWIKVRLLGTIPSPLIFGGLMDATCLLWHRTCDGYGNCLVHDNYYMSRYIFGLAFIGKLCSAIFYFMAWWWYVPPSNEKTVTENGSKSGSDETDTISERF